MGTLPDLTELRTKLESTILSYHSLEDKDWTLAKKLDNVTAWKRPSTEFNGYLVKVQGVVMNTPQRIIDHIRPGPCRKGWDKMMTSLEIVKTVDKDCCVVQYTTAGLLLNMISPREFVDFCFVREYENGLLFCGQSIPYEPSTSGCVRGFNHPCAWLCVPVDESQSLLTGYLQTDLGGLIPQFAVESAMANTMGSFYTELGKALKK